MDRPETFVECKTAEEVGRALYLGYAITCSEEVAEQCGATVHQEGVDAFTLEEIYASRCRTGEPGAPPPDWYYCQVED